SARDPVRYQGLVPLEADSLAGAFEDYFRRSEQLPTRLLLAAAGNRAAGLRPQRPPGDEGDADGGTRAGALFDTLQAGELLELPAADVLRRLFHEEGVETVGGRDLAFGCSCSRERVAAMLGALGADEARAAVIDGAARVRCEFCGERYAFDQAQVEALLAEEAPTLEAPARVQYPCSRVVISPLLNNHKCASLPAGSHRELRPPPTVIGSPCQASLRD